MCLLLGLDIDNNLSKLNIDYFRFYHHNNSPQNETNFFLNFKRMFCRQTHNGAY